jgi:hypothetical protein
MKVDDIGRPALASAVRVVPSISPLGGSAVQRHFDEVIFTHSG